MKVWFLLTSFARLAIYTCGESKGCKKVVEELRGPGLGLGLCQVCKCGSDKSM